MTLPDFQQCLYKRTYIHVQISSGVYKFAHFRTLNCFSPNITNVFLPTFQLCLVELKFNPDSINQPDPTLLAIYVVTTSILITHTVILHLALCHIDTSLDPIIASSNHSIEHFDFDWIPFQALFFTWDGVYVVGICGGFFLFTLCFILLLWIKFVQAGSYLPFVGMIFMGPVFLIVCIYGIVLYIREKRQRGEERASDVTTYNVRNDDLEVFAIIFCDRCKVHVEKYFTGEEMLQINDIDVPCCKYRKRLFRKLE